MSGADVQLVAGLDQDPSAKRSNAAGFGTTTTSVRRGAGSARGNADEILLQPSSSWWSALVQ